MKNSIGRSRRKWLVRLGILAATAFIFLNLLAFRHARTMMCFSSGGARTASPESLGIFQKIETIVWGVNIPRPESKMKVSALGPGARSLQIPGESNIKLGAWYCPGRPKSPLVILFHGYAGEKSSMVPEAKAFLQLGCSVLLVDFRGSGESSEAYTTVGYAEGQDVASAVHYARQNLGAEHIILYGISMGAAAVLRAACDCRVKPDAIILEAVFDKLLNAVRHRFAAMNVPAFGTAELIIFWGSVQAGFNGFHHNPDEYARSVTCPILFLHGTEDRRAFLDEGRRVFDAVPGPKVFREFPKIGHAAIVNRYPAQWKKAVGDFLQGLDRPGHP